MKKLKLKVSMPLLLVCLIFLNSCGLSLDVAKRHHSPGYYVNLSYDKRINSNEVEENENLEEAPIITKSDETAKRIVYTTPELRDTEVLDKNKSESNEVNKHPEVTSNKSRSDYKNADREELTAVFSLQQLFGNYSSTQSINKTMKTESISATNSGSRNKIVAAVLAFFLGGLGIHRFYLGYTTIGIVQLLLFILGLILIIPLFVLWLWVIIDFIRILVGDLQPKNGSYQ